MKRRLFYIVVGILCGSAVGCSCDDDGSSDRGGLPDSGTIEDGGGPGGGSCCSFEARDVYVDLANPNRKIETYIANGRFYRWYLEGGSQVTAHFEHDKDLTEIVRFGLENGPCYNLSAGACHFNTYNTYFGVDGKQVESITKDGKYYNYTIDDPNNSSTQVTAWAANGSTLSSVDRYMAGPCADAGATNCTFDSRDVHFRTATQLWESITAYGKYYVFITDFSTHPATTIGLSANGSTLLSVGRYEAGPCAGKSGTNCVFESRDAYITNTAIHESITAYGKYYNYTIGLTGGSVTGAESNGDFLQSVDRYVQTACAATVANGCEAQLRVCSSGGEPCAGVCCASGQQCVNQQCCSTPCGNSCCGAGQTCDTATDTCTGTCSASCASGALCCENEQTCTDNNSVCCPNAQIVDGECCSTTVCNGECCPSGYGCENNTCTPSGDCEETCDDGLCCDGPGDVCHNGTCCTTLLCNNTCCAVGQTCGPSGCVTPQMCTEPCPSSTNCCDANSQCIGGNFCCANANVCNGNECCAPSQCANDGCCPSGRVVCNGVCCAAGAECSGGQCTAGCPSGVVCEGECCAVGDVCATIGTNEQCAECQPDVVYIEQVPTDCGDCRVQSWRQRICDDEGHLGDPEPYGPCVYQCTSGQTCCADSDLCTGGAC